MAAAVRANNVPNDRGEDADEAVDGDDKKVACPLQCLLALIANGACSSFRVMLYLSRPSQTVYWSR